MRILATSTGAARRRAASLARLEIMLARAAARAGLPPLPTGPSSVGYPEIAVHQQFARPDDIATGVYEGGFQPAQCGPFTRRRLGNVAARCTQIAPHGVAGHDRYAADPAEAVAPCQQGALRFAGLGRCHACPPIKRDCQRVDQRPLARPPLSVPPVATMGSGDSTQDVRSPGDYLASAMAARSIP